MRLSTALFPAGMAKRARRSQLGGMVRPRDMTAPGTLGDTVAATGVERKYRARSVPPRLIFDIVYLQAHYQGLEVAKTRWG